MPFAPIAHFCRAHFRIVQIAVAVAFAAAVPASGQILDPSLHAYRPVNELSGQISLMGSTTMTNMASAWTDSFRQFYPNVERTLEIRGSRGAVAAVMSGDATFGLLSRKVFDSEVTAFTEKFGYEPKVVTVCMEHMAIYVHPDNPIRSLTLKQLQFALAGKTKTWGELGVEGAWADQPIRIHGRESETGSRVYLEQALRMAGHHKPAYQHTSNRALVSAIASDKLGLGYAGLIYSYDGVKDVPLALTGDRPAIKVDSLAAAQGQYPLMRPLQLVVNQKPGKPLAPVANQFVEYVLSRTGQEDVIRAGFQPIAGTAADIAHEQLDTGIVR